MGAETEEQQEKEKEENVNEEEIVTLGKLLKSLSSLREFSLK